MTHTGESNHKDTIVDEKIPEEVDHDATIREQVAAIAKFDYLQGRKAGALLVMVATDADPEDNVLQRTALLGNLQGIAEMMVNAAHESKVFKSALMMATAQLIEERMTALLAQRSDD